MSTNVADESFIGAMISECNRAVRALANVAAAVALQRAGKAAAVQKQDGLFAFGEALLERGAESI